jgi:four helix bundle protein
MKSYRDLEIYTLSKKLAIEVHKLSMSLPKYELYEEGQQVRRSSKAIASAIVEGFARRRYKKDFLKYLIYAHAECDETILHLEFIREIHAGEYASSLDVLRSGYENLSKKINRYTDWAELHFNFRDTRSS